MRFVFVTNPFDAESHLVLRALLQAGHSPAAVLTPRQRRKGKGLLRSVRAATQSRGYLGFSREAAAILARQLRLHLRTRLRGLPGPSASAEEVACVNGIPVLNPRRAAEPWVAACLRELGADLLVSCFCTQRLPQSLIGSAAQGGLNLHRSLLPRYAGPRPIFWALYYGEQETGVTVHRLAEQLDAGEVLAQRRLPIMQTHTETSLGKDLTDIGSLLLVEVLDALEAGRALPPVRPPADGSYFSRPNRQHLAALRRSLARRRQGVPS